jgi:hypothetical protein
METCQKTLAEETTEEMLNFTAGENVWTLPSEKGETNNFATQEMLKNLNKENRAEINALRRQIIYLQNYVMQSDDEIKELRGIIQEMKESMEGLKGRGPDSSSLSYPESRTTNVQEITMTTPGAEEENTSISQNTDKTTPVLCYASANQYKGNSEIALLLFDENTVNPVFHLKQLGTYMRLRNIPEEIKLTLAFRSLGGETSQAWVETMMEQIIDYPAFKRELLKMWWSPSKQSLVRCQLYQGKYNQHMNLSLSAYFLKQVTMASYLEPKPTEIEIIEALRFHYPIDIQKSLLNIQTRTISETLEILKRIELLDIQEHQDHALTRNIHPIRGERNVRYTCPETRPINRNSRNTGHFNSRKIEQHRPRVNLGDEGVHLKCSENSWDKDPRSNPKGQNGSSGN